MTFVRSVRLSRRLEADPPAPPFPGIVRKSILVKTHSADMRARGCGVGVGGCVWAMGMVDRVVTGMIICVEHCSFRI